MRTFFDNLGNDSDAAGEKVEDIHPITFSEETKELDEGAASTIPAGQQMKSMQKHASQSSQTEGYLSLVRSFIKNISIYAIASFLIPLSGLILVPFLTHSLSSHDYGAFVVLSTVLDLIGGITQLGLVAAFIRACGYDYESESDQRSVISTVVTILLLTSLPTAMIMLTAAPWLAQLLFNEPSLSGAVRIVAFLLLLKNLVVPGYTWLRIENRAVSYTIISTLALLVNLGATIVLVGILHRGIAGALIAIGCSNACIFICTSFDFLRRINLRFRFDIARSLLFFGLPLVPNYVSLWIMQLADRFLLSHLASLSEAGRYNVAYVLGGILGVVVLSPFLMIWPTAQYTIAKRDDAAHVFRIMFRWYSLFLLFATGGLLLASTAVLYFMFPPSYFSAAPVMPIVAVSIVFYGLYWMLTVGASLERKNWILLLISVVSALLNVGANFVLIPRYGSMGAAVSTLIAYAVLALVTYVMNQRIHPLPLEVGRFGIALCIGTAFYIGCRVLTAGLGIHTTYVVYSCAFVLFSACLIGIGMFRTRGRT